MLGLKLSPNVSLAGLVTGASLIGLAFACGGDSDKVVVASPTESATATAIPTSTATPPPTPTPTPFAGKVARLKFPRFGVDAPIEELSVDATDTMQTPAHGRENSDVGWYNSALKPTAPFLGTRPGWQGNAVFSAHVYYISSAVCPNNPLACPAPFQRLAQSKPGDEVIVTMENGIEYHYKVISYKQYTRDNIPMGDIISPPEQPKDKQWITLITCGGALDSSGVEYVSRDVVVAERVS